MCGRRRSSDRRGGSSSLGSRLAQGQAIPVACVRSGVCSSAQRGRDAVALAGSETGTAHGRGGPYRVECRFSLRFCGFLIYVKATCRAPMCADPLCAHGSTTTSLGDMGGSLEFQRKLAFAPSDRLSPMCEPASHSPLKGPRSRSGRWRSGHPAGFEGPVRHDRADRAQCLLGSAFPRSGIAVGSHSAAAGWLPGKLGY